MPVMDGVSGVISLTLAGLIYLLIVNISPSVYHLISGGIATTAINSAGIS